MAAPGYSLDTSSRVNTGPNVGGNSSSGGVNVGGNPNVSTAIQSATSLLSHPLTLVIVGCVVVGVAYFYFKARK